MHAPAIVAKLEDSDGRVRIAAVQALGKLHAVGDVLNALFERLHQREVVHSEAEEELHEQLEQLQRPQDGSGTATNNGSGEDVHLHNEAAIAEDGVEDLVAT